MAARRERVCGSEDQVCVCVCDVMWCGTAQITLMPPPSLLLCAPSFPPSVRGRSGTPRAGVSRSSLCGTAGRETAALRAKVLRGKCAHPEEWSDAVRGLDAVASHGADVDAGRRGDAHRAVHRPQQPREEEDGDVDARSRREGDRLELRAVEVDVVGGDGEDLEVDAPRVEHLRPRKHRLTQRPLSKLQAAGGQGRRRPVREGAGGGGGEEGSDWRVCC